jgi:hypothetical protein
VSEFVCVCVCVCAGGGGGGGGGVGVGVWVVCHWIREAIVSTAAAAAMVVEH